MVQDTTFRDHFESPFLHTIINILLYLSDTDYVEVVDMEYMCICTYTSSIC